MSSLTRTANGALSLNTTGDPRVDFFFKVLRSTGDNELIRLLQQSHNKNIDDTIKLVFHLRDSRGGKGERKQFINCIKWYATHGYKKEVIDLLGWMPYYGRWKDLLDLLDLDDGKGEISHAIYKLFANALKSDKERYSQNLSISLAAKWAPSEGCKFDKRFGCAQHIANALGVSLKTYRKLYLTPLRAYSNVTEVWMCSGEWDKIQYEKVASVCMHKNKKSFLKHDETGFKRYLELVKSGDQKINASQLFPHQLVEKYITSRLGVDPVIEAQWTSLVQHYRNNQNFKLDKCLCVCDVSGSMHGEPMNVCIGLGLLISELTAYPFGNQVITFHSTPTFCDVSGTTLYEKVNNLLKIPWGMSTNLQAVFKLILEKCLLFKIPANECPSQILVLSDMQFNSCVSDANAGGGGELTNYQAICKQYTDAGYKVPQIIFWNLRGDTSDFPVSSNESQIALVSGFSPSIIKLFMEGTIATPYDIMRCAIDDPRYSNIRLSDHSAPDINSLLYRNPTKKHKK